MDMALPRPEGFGPLADALPCGVLRIDADGMIVAANATLLAWVGRSQAELLGQRSLVHLLSSAGQVYWKTHLLPQLRRNGRLDEVALALPDVQGTPRHCLISGRVSDTDHSTSFVLFEAGRRRNLELEQARFGLAAQVRARWLAQLERMAGVGAWSCDPLTGEIEASDRVFDLLGLEPHAGLTLKTMLARFVSSKVRAAICDDLRLIGVTHEPIEQEITISTPAGALRRLQFHAEPEWQKGELARIVGVINDVTRRHDDQRRLWQAANIDELTGLANRRLFLRRLQLMIPTGPFALVLLDLDEFNAVNDLLGADASDALLREVAERLARLAGPDAVAARLGGDEFALLLPDPDPDTAALRVADLAREALRQPFDTTAAVLTASIGLATFPDDAEDADGLLRCARQALAEVKAGFPDTAAFLRGQTRARFEARRTAIAFVQEAARAGRILAWYQPKVRLDTRKIAGYEALARIRAEDGTICGPEVWGAALDDIDCARLVDGSVLDAVLGDLAQDPGRLIRVGVNFSESSLRGMDFAEQILALIAARGVSPALIELEVVETVLLGQRLGSLSRGFSRLRNVGMRIALDDFGTGFASLSHLRDLPIDRIKLDKSFVLGLGEDHRNAPILRAILDLAAVLGLDTVAEGIESEKAAVYLRGLGCREGQGFRFGPARPFDALPDPAVPLR